MDVTHSLKTDIFGHLNCCPKVTRNAGKSMRLILRLFLLCLFITNGVLALAQVSFDSQEELEKAANEFFDSKQYDKAKPLYSQLLSLNALDPNYNYRFGVCILYTEADPLKPLPYIEGGANTSGVNNEAYYFLGKAYQLNYRFDDAIGYFNKAKKTGFAASDVDLDRSIEECRNGKLLYSEVEFTPAQNKEVIESEFYRPYDFRKLKGKVIPMPPNFKTKYDQKNLKGTVVYTPSNSQTLIYASYGEDGANRKDLYQVNRLPNGEWALPQRLPDNINTKYDEDFAFFDDESSTLFFASKGHNTMGGFDIFRSVYSAESNKWSQPTNLQYPINSPFDDFLYVSDPNGKVAFFTSRRDSDLEKLRVFKTLLHDPSQVELSVVEGTYEDRTDSVFNYMMATVFDPKTNEVVGKYRSNKETGKYVLILPPQNDYKLDVGPNESAGFQFDLDVPKHEETKPLQQSMAYDANDSDGTVIVTNYFNAAGKKDSVALAANRSKSEVEKGMVELPERSTILASQEKLKEVEEQAKAARLAELAALEEAKLMAELAKNDSIEAVKKAAREAEVMRLQAEAARKDSLAQAQEELKAKLAKEKAVVDSLAAVELALAQERDKAIADSISNAQELAAEKQRIKNDSIAEAARLAAEKAQQEKATADSLALLAEVKAAEEARLARERVINDSIAAVERAAFEAALLVKEQAKKDSIKAAELAAAEKVESPFESTEGSLKEIQEKATADSLALLAEAKAVEEARLARERAINDSIAAAERAAFEAELAAIEQAMKDSIEAAEVAAVEVETPSESVDELLKEMQEKEAEILASQAEEKPIAVTESASETTIEESKEAEPIVEEVAAAATDSSETEEPLSDADLFLQTIANLEKQKVAQEQAVEEENKRLAEEKAMKAEVEAIAQAEKVAADTSGVQELEVAISDSVKQAVEETKDIETQSVALKSDADPNEYLAALAEMEAEMEADNAKNNKSYELRELEPMAETSSDIDPKLQQMIDADRKALEEHQRMAQAKEKELKEQRERDKQALSEIGAEPSADEELAAIEAELLEGLKGKKLVTKLTVDSAENVETLEESVEPEIVEVQEEETKEEVEAELIAEADELVNELVETEVAETPEETLEEPSVAEEVVAETPEVEVASQPEKVNEETALIAEADEVINDLLAEEVQAEPESATEKAVTEVSEELSEVVEAPEEVAAVQEEAVEETVEVTVAKEVTTEVSVEPTQEEAKVVEEALETKSEEVAVNEDMEVNEFGQRIPFLEPALRDYSSREKPNFNAIENATMRRLVKRMRSEDIGRMAVLKNMKNQWVDQGKTKESLQAIKENERNQEVLANLVEPVAREEKIRDPFDVNDTRAREGVYYQLEFKLVSAGVSETVREAMTPEQEMTFAMPEFNITTDHFGNLADARAEMRYYKQRGFDSVAVVAYLNGDRILLSDAENIPFID